MRLVPLNDSLERTRASRSVSDEIGGLWRLAPVADLHVRQALAIMKNEGSRYVRFIWMLAYSLSAGELSVSAQTSMGLKIDMNAGQAQITVTGAVGTACQIQWTDDLSMSNQWCHLAHAIITDPPSPLTDSTSSSALRRYYRAVWAPNTNLVWISPGTFSMGSPTNEALRLPDETQHVVTISHGFWMGKYLVTQGDYLAVMGSNPSYFTPRNAYSEDLTRPVESVSWNDATNYCALRTQLELAAGLIPTNCLYRLATESEWEYADRAGTTTAFYLGSGLHSGQANFYGPNEYDASVGIVFNDNGVFPFITTPVGSYSANCWGLYDTIGNVWEFCQDWYGDYPSDPETDPQGPDSGSVRIIRGGDWDGDGNLCRSASRGLAGPEGTDDGTGFRIVLAHVR